MREPHRPQVIKKIVITGGPCAGKTTALSWIQKAFSREGTRVLFVDETATELSAGGAPSIGKRECHPAPRTKNGRPFR